VIGDKTRSTRQTWTNLLSEVSWGRDLETHDFTRSCAARLLPLAAGLVATLPCVTK